MGSGGGSQGEPGAPSEAEASLRAGPLSVMETQCPRGLPEKQLMLETLGLSWDRAFCGWWGLAEKVFQKEPCKSTLQKGSSKNGLPKVTLQKSLLKRAFQKHLAKRVLYPPQGPNCPGSGQQPKGEHPPVHSRDKRYFGAN